MVHKRPVKVPKRQHVTSRVFKKTINHYINYKKTGGPGRNRTGIQGFAVLCITTLPPGHPDACECEGASYPRKLTGLKPLGKVSDVIVIVTGAGL